MWLSLQALAAASVSLLSTLLLTMLARAVAHRIGAVDRPDGHRKLQRQPVALLGGVAVLGGLAVTVLAASAVGAISDAYRSIMLVGGGLALICAVGVFDDIWNLRAGWKLLAQILAAVPIVIASTATGEVQLFGMQYSLEIEGALIAVAWLVACTNAVNLIDGMDGLCATVGLCVAAGVVAVACLTGSTHTVLCAAALAGALAGFLKFNAPPATIYLGDAGSMVIGMTLGLLTLHASQDLHGVTHPIYMLALMAVPLGDVMLAMLRRSLSGKSIWHADRGHIHHRLLDHGLSVRQSLGVIGLVCLTTGAVCVGAKITASDAFCVVSLGCLGVVLVNRKVAGAHEWSLVQAMFARPIVGDATFQEEPAATILRFDVEPTPVLKLFRPGIEVETSGDEVQEPPRRKAA